MNESLYLSKLCTYFLSERAFRDCLIVLVGFHGGKYRKFLLL